MAFEIPDVMKAQFQTLEAEHRRAAADLENAREIEDGQGTMEAARRIIQIKAEHAALSQLAGQYQAATAQAQSQPQTKYGLSQEEAEIARNSFGAIKRNGRMVDLSDDEKLRTYAENKAEYRRKLSTGEYSNQFQTTVRR